jgi:hypothetical protein
MNVRILSVVATMTLLAMTPAGRCNNCPEDCAGWPTNPDPSYYDCDHALVNCVGTVGTAYVKSTQRTGVADVAMASCDSCGEKNKGSVAAGFGIVTVDTSWTVNLPYGIGSVSGGGDQTSVDLSGTLNCQDCKSIRAPYYKYNVTVTMGIPYTLEKRVGYMHYVGLGICDIFNYALVKMACPNGYEAQATYHTYEGALGATEDLGCEEPQPCPCNS